MKIKRIVFHNFYLINKQDEYGCTMKEFVYILRCLIKKRSQGNAFEIHFDDGKKNAFFPLLMCLCLDFDCVIGVISSEVGLHGFMGRNHLLLLSKFKNCSIASHSVNHVGLYPISQDFPALSNKYVDSPRGKKYVLPSERILYQIVESKKEIAGSLGITINKFVLPYGLYDDVVLREALKSYSIVYTCDSYDMSSVVLGRDLFKRGSSCFLRDFLE